MSVRRRLTLVFGALLGFLSLVVALRPVIAQKEQSKVSTKRVVSRGNANAADANIKKARGAATHGKVQPPPSKGGAKTRGKAFGRLHVDSRVSVPVDIFMDGEYVGTVSAEGDATGEYDTGRHTVYGKDDDGCRWGPSNVTIYAGEVTTWTITE